MKDKIIKFGLLFLVIATIVWAGTTVVGDDIWVSGFAYYKSPIAQYHRTASIETNNTNWNNVSWDLIVESESTDFVNLTDENESIEFTRAGVYRVQGCGHIDSDLGAAATAKVLIRVIIDDVEARCLQASRNKNFLETEVDILPFTGTINASDGSKLQVQYQVSNTGLDFDGDTDFDNPIAFSVNLEKISDLP